MDQRHAEGPNAPSLTVLEEDLQKEEQSIAQFVSGVPDVVENNEQYEAAMVEIINVRDNRKKAEKFFKDLIQPMVEALADIKAKIAKALEPIKAKEQKLNDNIVAYANRLEAEAEAAKQEAERQRAQELADAINADEPVMPQDSPPPLQLSDTPKTVKTGTRTGGLTDIPKWKFAKHPEINSDEDEDIYLDDPRAEGIDRRLFVLDRGRVTTWNKSKTPMAGIEHFYGKTVAVNKRRS